MSSDTFYFSGMTKWAKVTTPDPKFNVYTLDLYLDAPSMKLFKDSGLQLQIRKDEKDGAYIKLRRPASKMIKKEVVDLGPPTLLIKAPTKDDPDHYEPFNDLIGNGSSVICKVRVYDTMKGKGHELETVAVEALVPYVQGESFTPDGNELPF